MRIVMGAVVAVWLFVGGMAADQRGDFAYGGGLSCSSVAEVSLTMAAGPLNYQGVDPDVSCRLPRAS